MADLPVKSRIIARLLGICDPLIAEQRVRSVKRVLSPFLTESVKPALHLVIGHEVVLYQDERGYNSEFPASFKLILDDGGERENIADELAAYLEEKVEADEQLGGLCSKITFDGVYPYIDDLIPGGFIMVSYKIEFRRYRGAPTVGY